MTITAVWSDLEPGTVVERELHEKTLATPGDVREFVAALAVPHTSEAHLVHSGRPKVFDDLFQQMEHDHQVFVAVGDNFGYLEYFGPQNWSQPVGDPSSPAYHKASQGYFAAGTGVALDVLVAALTEFLITAERPTGFRWRELDRE